MKNKFIFFLISIILAILFIEEYSFFYLFAFITLNLFVFVKVGYKFNIALLISFAFFIIYKPNKQPNINIKQNQFVGRVILSKESYSIVKYEKNNFLIYNDEFEFYKNDILEFKAEIRKIPLDGNLYGFEFKEYLNKQRTFYMFDNVYDLCIVKRNIPLNIKIVNYLVKNHNGYNEIMTKMLLFNDKLIDKDSYENLKEMNALHLFIVSGFHINFLYGLFYFLFKKVNENIAKIFSVFLIFFYLFLLDFSISSTRAFLCLLIPLIDTKKALNRLDNLSIAGIIILLIEPLNLYSYSFIMSFVLTFFIILSRKILVERNFVVRTVLLSFVATLTILPIVLTINYKINFLNFLSNMILSQIVYVFMILSFTGLCIPSIGNVYFAPIYRLFFSLIERLNSISSPLIFGHPPFLFVFIYYFILFIMFIYLEKQKAPAFVISFSLLVGLLTIFYNKNKFIPYQQLTFLDVYQGDCTIIEDSYGKGVIIVDTGGLINYDIANNKIIPYLEYKGIKKVDIVVITHDDYDHCGALSNLIQSTCVKQVITSPETKTIKIGSLLFNNLNNYHHLYEDSNSKSIVLYGKVANLNILLTGDIDKKIELQIIKDNPNLEVDVLKVAHHGSKYSTGEEFVEQIKPRIAVISVGYNHYNHPAKEVIETLLRNNCIVYRTDQVGTLKISFRLNKYYCLEKAK